MASPLCPRCRVALQSAVTRNVTLHVCPACGGAWLDNLASKRVVEYFESEAVAAAGRAASAAKANPDTSLRGIPCPLCQAPLKTTSVAPAGVVVDYCSEHGTWFDRNELEQVSRALAKQRQQSFQAHPPATGATDLAAADPSNAALTAVVAGSVAVDVASGVADSAASSFFEITIDILGGILSVIGD